jgi:hypothetical protein
VSDDWQGYLVTGAITVGALGLMLLIFWLRSRYGGPDRVELAVIVEDPNEGPLLVTSEAVTYAPDHGESVADERLTARRLSDGVKTARLMGPSGLALLGAGPAFLWCSSREMPVHTRRPATLEVLNDAAAIVAAGKLGALKPLTGGNDPEFDPATSSVHAFTLDGRGVLIDPYMRVKKSARDDVDHVDPDRVRLEHRANYGDVARLWLAGEMRLALHGLQPQPAEAPEFVKGNLVLTRALEKAPPEPLTILVFHRESLDERAAEMLTCVALDGKHRWTRSFAKPTIARANWLFLTGGKIVLVLKDDGGPYEALALDEKSGEVIWRTRL